MDHIPLPVNAQYSHCRIPYFGLEYDRQGFFGFAERCGWKHEWKVSSRTQRPAPYLNTDEGSGQPPCEKFGFLQAWLFFGVLVDILGISGVSVDVADFIVSEDGSSRITTKLLPVYLDQWAEKEKSCDIETQRQHLADVAKILLIPGPLLDYGPFFHPYWELSASIAILGETLENAAYCIWRPWEVYTALGSPPNLFPTRKFYLERRYSSNGRCWDEFEALSYCLNSTALYYASNLSGPVNYHAHCGGNLCFVRSVDDDNYETSHTTTNCFCPHAPVDHHRVLEILNSGKTPSVLVRTDESGHNVQVEIVESEPQSYVAVSHVWYHGLGNTKGNTLPKCQLLYLAAAAKALFSLNTTSTNNADSPAAVPFWIDTICVPIIPKGKKLAIRKLRQTFGEASRVLVLDQELLHATSQCDIEEIRMRVNRCSWMRRLWTLQESQVSRDKLYFLFGDGFVPVARLDAPVPRMLHYRLGRSSAKFFNLCLPKVRKTGNHYNDLTWLCRAILFRTTTKEEDKPICLASLQGLDDEMFDRPEIHKLIVFEFEHALKELQHGVLYKRELMNRTDWSLSRLRFLASHPEVWIKSTNPTLEDASALSGVVGNNFQEAVYGIKGSVTEQLAASVRDELSSKEVKRMARSLFERTQTPAWIEASLAEHPSPQAPAECQIKIEGEVTQEATGDIFAKPSREDKQNVQYLKILPEDAVHRWPWTSQRRNAIFPQRSSASIKSNAKVRRQRYTPLLTTGSTV